MTLFVRCTRCMHAMHARDACMRWGVRRRHVVAWPPLLLLSPTSPFSALGVERLADARILNNVNRRTLLKKYRKLALELHPDRCDHELAVDAMQLLNTAYEKVVSKHTSTGPSPMGQRRGAASRYASCSARSTTR